MIDQRRRRKRRLKLTAIDLIPDMVAFYNSDQAITYGKVAKRFNVTPSRVQELLSGLVERRLGKVQKDGTRRQIIPIASGQQLGLFQSERELATRRRRRAEAHKTDPDVVRYQEERLKRNARRMAVFDDARKELERAWNDLTTRAVITNPCKRKSA